MQFSSLCVALFTYLNFKLESKSIGEMCTVVINIILCLNAVKKFILRTSLYFRFLEATNKNVVGAI